MTNIPLGILVLSVLFSLVLAGMAYEEGMRPKFVMRSLIQKIRNKLHI